jgi:hypothetical protein
MRTCESDPRHADQKQFDKLRNIATIEQLTIFLMAQAVSPRQAIYAERPTELRHLWIVFPRVSTFQEQFSQASECGACF